jgi:hypothetical protein
LESGGSRERPRHARGDLDLGRFGFRQLFCRELAELFVVCAGRFLQQRELWDLVLFLLELLRGGGAMGLQRAREGIN